MNSSDEHGDANEAVERAREIGPNRMILIERVRENAGPGRHKWRKA